jgi:hypothetical protein
MVEGSAAPLWVKSAGHGWNGSDRFAVWTVNSGGLGLVILILPTAHSSVPAAVAS